MSTEDLIDKAVAALTNLRSEIGEAQAAATLDRDLKASLESIKKAHTKAEEERAADQRKFDIERAQHDAQREAWKKELSDIHSKIVAAETNLKAVKAETDAKLELHDRILHSMGSLKQRLMGVSPGPIVGQ
jgi:chromosome segregation ATPase